MPMRLPAGRLFRTPSRATRRLAIARGAKLCSAQARTISSLATSAPILSGIGCICMVWVSRYRLKLLGWRHTDVSLRSNRRSGWVEHPAARFLIDVGGVGGRVLPVSVHLSMAESQLGPSTPAPPNFPEGTERNHTSQPGREQLRSHFVAMLS